MDKESLSLEDVITITVNIKNTGDVAGAEVVQIYATDVESSVDRPPKELVGFGKIFLDPQEENTIEISVKVKDLAFYDVTSDGWNVEAGKFKLLIGTSSRSILFEKNVNVKMIIHNIHIGRSKYTQHGQ